MEKPANRAPGATRRIVPNEAAELHAVPSPRSLNHGLAVRLAHRAFLRCLTEAIASHRLTGVEFLVLRTLWDYDGITQTEVAERISLDGPHLTSTLNAMEKKQLVKRSRNARDRRKVNVHLTRKARQYRDRLVPRLMLVSEAAARGIPADELDVLHRVLRRMMDNLAEFSAPPAVTDTAPAAARTEARKRSGAARKPATGTA
jgi:DNA-binding MarR family transcriptional regulator